MTILFVLPTIIVVTKTIDPGNVF